MTPTATPRDLLTVDEDVSMSRVDWIWSIGIAAALGLLYAWQLQPGISLDGDISKFQFAGPLGGTVHQTGYPLYLMLSWVVAHLPFSSPSTGTTALSAVFAAGAAVMTYVALRELRVRPFVAAAFSLVLGVAPIVFYYAVVAEVYSLHLLFIAGTAAMLLRWRRTRADLDLGVAIVLLALSLTNHMTTVVLIPGMLWFVFKTDRATFRRPGVWLFGAASLVASGLAYGYLIWRAGDPTAPFIEVAPESWRDLPAIWVGAGGAGLFLGPGEATEIVRRVPGVVGSVARHALIALPLALIGFRALWRDAAGAMLAWIGASSLVFLLIFDTSNPQSFLSPMVFVVVVAGAVGADWAVERYEPRAAVIAGLLVLVLAVSVADGVRFVEFQSSDEYEQGMRGWFADVPADSVLAASYSDAMAAFYVQLIENDRGDIDVVSDYPLRDPAGSVIGRYLAGEAVEVPHTRAILQPGRSVYAPGKGWACDLAAAGFGIEPYVGDLYRVFPLTEPGPGALNDLCGDVGG